jgi:hypothetical protein
MVSDGSALFCRHLDHIDSSLTTIFLSRDQESNEIVVWEAVMFSHACHAENRNEDCLKCWQKQSFFGPKLVVQPLTDLGFLGLHVLK